MQSLQHANNSDMRSRWFLEQGKQTLRMDKINQVLALFGHEVGAVPAASLRQ